MKGSDAGVPRPDPHPISQPWPGLSTSHGSGWRRAEAASEIGNSLGTSACAPAIGHIISPQLVQGAVPAMPPQACSVHLIALVLLSCPVLGLAAAVPWIGRQAQKLTKPAREGLGRPWEMDGTLKSGKGSHLPRCPFIQQTFLGLTLEGGICAGGAGGSGALSSVDNRHKRTRKIVIAKPRQVAVRFPHNCKTGGSYEARDPQNKHSHLGAALCPHRCLLAAMEWPDKRRGSPPVTRRSWAFQTTPGTLRLHIDLPLGLSNACLRLKDYFITRYLSRLGRVE